MWCDRSMFKNFIYFSFFFVAFECDIIIYHHHIVRSISNLISHTPKKPTAKFNKCAAITHVSIWYGIMRTRRADEKAKRKFLIFAKKKKN